MSWVKPWLAPQPGQWKDGALKGLSVSEAPVTTTIQIALQGDKLTYRGPNVRTKPGKEMALRILKQMIAAIEGGHPAQVDAGRGGARLLLPAHANLTDLYHEHRKKV